MRTSARIEIQRFDKRLDAVIDQLSKAGYNPEQERKPKGSSGGGQWVGRGGGSGSSEQPKRRDGRSREARAERHAAAARQKALESLTQASKAKTPEQISEATKSIKAVNDKLTRLKELDASIDFWGKVTDWAFLAAIAGTTFEIAIKIGEIHPVAGLVAAVAALGYTAYDIYKTIKRHREWAK